MQTSQTPPSADIPSEMAALKLALLQAREVQAVSRDINAAQDARQVLQALAQPAFDAGAAVASLAYADLDENNAPIFLETVVSLGEAAEQVAPVGMRVRWARHAVAQMLEAHSNLPLYIADAQHDPDLKQVARSHLARFGIGAEVAIPLR